MVSALAVRVGSVHETEDQSGIAHALEHLVFRGSVSRSGEDLQKAFAQSGGYLNAQTDEDSTVFQGITLAADLSDAVALMSEIIREPRLDADDLELEKQIIQQESCRGCFGCTMRDNMFDQAFPDQPLRHPIIGYEDTVAELSRDDLVAFHHQAYVGQWRKQALVRSAQARLLRNLIWHMVRARCIWAMQASKARSGWSFQ